MKLELCSVNDKIGLNRVYMLLNSLKLTKQDDTVIHYRLVLEDINDEVREYFKDLQSEDFIIQYIDTEWFKQRINPPRKVYLHYVRCLLPTYLADVDKLLYLDTDTIFLQDGVQELWNVDITDYSIGAAEDQIVVSFKHLDKELKQTKAKHYFNSGVCLMNLKRIRQTGKAQQLADWVLNWNKDILKPLYATDQTLLNYLFRDDVKIIDYKYNDYSLVTSKTTYEGHKKQLKQKYGYQQPLQSVKDAIILHFLGQMKPWKATKKVDDYYMYSKMCRQVWNEVESHLQKKKEYHFFSAINDKYVWLEEMICLGLKKYMKASSRYVYHIMIDAKEKTLDQYQKLFKQYQDEDFKVDIMSYDLVASKIKECKGREIQLARCLLPSLLPQLDKILYMDTDLFVIGGGIEQLFDVDSSNFYALVSSDPVQYYEKDQLINTHVDNYFNSGVMLLNLKKIREDGIDKLLEQDLIKSPVKPTHYDQSILNYRFKQNVAFVSPRYNNMLFGLASFYTRNVEEYYKNFGWNSLFDSVKDTVILHFYGPKPWDPKGDMYSSILPYRQQAKRAVEKIKEQLGYTK